MPRAESPQQRNLFDMPSLRVNGLARAIKLSLNRAAGKSKLSRDELVIEANKIAAEAGINMCPNGVLSIATFNKWLDPNAAGYLPAVPALAVLALLLEARVISPLLEALDLEVMGPNDRKLRDLGKASVEAKKLRKKIRQIEDEL